MGGLDFSIFGQDEEKIKVVFTICQLKDISPAFCHFLESYPIYNEYNIYQNWEERNGKINDKTTQEDA